MIYSARDIAKQLAGRAESFCKFLLPNGQKLCEGKEWCVGSPGGEQGYSMRVHLTGESAGVWADFAGTAKGDMLGLVKEVRGVDIRAAIKIAKEFLGINEPEQKTYSRPKPKDCTPIPQKSAVKTYLQEQRHISEFTLINYDVQESTDGKQVVFNSYSLSGELENVKYLSVERDERGKKIIRQYGGCAPALFGWQAIDGESRELLICEGEVDALSWCQVGFPAVSVPMGAGNDQWIDYEWDNLLQFDTIYLNYDGDSEGKKGAMKVAQRLGLHRCMIVHLPDHKDANEALQQGELESYFQQAILHARPFEPEQLKHAMDFRDRVVDKFYPPNDEPPGFYSNLFGTKFAMRPGETTVWTGISSHGKTALLSQLTMEALIEGYKVAIASMEMKGEQSLYKMICQAEASNRPPLEHIDAILSWMGGKLWIYDVFGNVPRKQLMELMRYSFARHGVDIFVIDSLMKTDVVSDDYNGQREFLNEVCSFAMETGSHVNIVAHARKGKDESAVPGKLDVKGSSDIINQPDNVLTVWRNREKESNIRLGQVGDEQAAKIPDTMVFCEKQRDTGVEFVKELKFIPAIFRFTHMDDRPLKNMKISELVFGPQIMADPEEPMLIEDEPFEGGNNGDNQ